MAAGRFLISLDFELFWGVRHTLTLEEYGVPILGVRQAIPALLDLFREYEIRATWAAVGLALFDSKKELRRYLPSCGPSYANHQLNPYHHLGQIGDDERGDPYHYGLSLVRRIQAAEGMELASHTFSHYYCLEAGQTPAQFREDMEASVAAMDRLGVRPASVVFPRNEYAETHLEVCRELGIEAHRNARAGTCRLQPCRPGRRILEPLRLSRITRAMTAAAREGGSFHLWWNPHDFGTNLGENLIFLTRILGHFAGLRERYGMRSSTMGEEGGAVKRALSATP